MDDVIGWASIGLILLIGPLLLVIGLMNTFSRRPVEEKYRERSGGGIVGGFEAVWSPTAHDAGFERDRMTRRTAPAPSPGDPPSPITGSRITIDI